jgi:hypothetical protein
MDPEPENQNMRGSAMMPAPEEDDDELEASVEAVHWPPTLLHHQAGHFCAPPSLEEAKLALADLKLILKPPRDNRKGGYKDAKLDQPLHSWLERMSMFLWFYIDMSQGVNEWMGASFKAANAFQKGSWLAGRLQEWTHAYVKDRANLPLNIYGT